MDTLLSLGADATLTSNQGLTAQQWALQLGFDDVAESLAAQEASQAEVAAMTEAADALAEYHAGNDADRVDIALIVKLLEYICGEGGFATQVCLFSSPQPAVGA